MTSDDILREELRLINIILDEAGVPKYTGPTLISVVARVRMVLGRLRETTEALDKADSRLTRVRQALQGLPHHTMYPVDDQVTDWERSLRTAGRVIPPEEQIRLLRSRVSELEQPAHPLCELEAQHTRLKQERDELQKRVDKLEHLMRLRERSVEMKSGPDQFYVHDPDQDNLHVDGIKTYSTAEEAEFEASCVLERYRDSADAYGWPAGADKIRWGRLVPIGQAIGEDPFYPDRPHDNIYTAYGWRAPYKNYQLVRIVSKSPEE